MIEADIKKPEFIVQGEANDIVGEFCNIVYWALHDIGDAQGIDAMNEMETALFDAYKEGVRQAWKDVGVPPSKLRKFLNKLKGE